jgi:hypothetical protein
MLFKYTRYYFRFLEVNLKDMICEIFRKIEPYLTFLNIPQLENAGIQTKVAFNCFLVPGSSIYQI